MTVQLSCDKTELKKNDTALYTVKINTDKPIDSAIIEIFPSLEIYPDAAIVPDSESVTAENNLQTTSEAGENGIFTITLPSTGENTSVNVSFTAHSTGFTDKNTSAASVTAYRNGAPYEAYSQVSVNGSSALPLFTGVPAAIITAAAVILFYRIFLHSR